VTVDDPEAELERLRGAGLVEASDPGPGGGPPAFVGHLSVHDTTVRGGCPRAAPDRADHWRLGPMTPLERAVFAAGIPLPEVSSGHRHVAADPESFRSLLRWAADERLTGLLCQAIGDGSIALDTPSGSSLADEVHEAHRTLVRHSLGAEATAIEVIELLAEDGIVAYPFKGVANAHLDYPDPALRTFLDADLHVERPRFGDAITALLAAGYTRTSVPLGERWERQFARACELRAPNGVEVDLHASVATGFFGTILDDDALRAGPETIELAGRTLPAFSLPARALISCYSIVLSRGPGLRLQRDLAQQLVAMASDWPRMIDLAGRDGEVVVARSLDTVASMFGPALLEPDALDWASTVTPTKSARRALELADRAHDTGWSADARSTMLALDPTDTARYLGGIAIGRLRRLRR